MKSNMKGLMGKKMRHKVYFRTLSINVRVQLITLIRHTWHPRDIFCCIRSRRNFLMAHCIIRTSTFSLSIASKAKDPFIFGCPFLFVLFTDFKKDNGWSQINKNYRIGQLQPAHHSCTSYAWKLVALHEGSPDSIIKYLEFLPHTPPSFGFFNFFPSSAFSVFKKSITSATAFFPSCFFVYLFFPFLVPSVWWTIIEDTHRYSSKTCLFSFQIASIILFGSSASL